MQMFYRPALTEEIITQINETIMNNPSWGRTKISRYLCELWDWRMPDGGLKDISCRDMLRALDKAGSIKLPCKQKDSGMFSGSVKAKQLTMSLFPYEKTQVEAPLKTLLPLAVLRMEGKEQLCEFKAHIEEYHYLGFGGTVGENMKYMVRSSDGVLLACLLFGSAAWACKDRDEYIGWSKSGRNKNLQLMTNNTRFLILPWVKVPHLASHVLSLVLQRLSLDWEEKYGHPIYCLETFVEQGRFKGTCYKAANFICVGKTAGRGRDDITGKAKLPIKDIYLYPLHKRYRELLCREDDSK
jgi:hypothetical protein